MPFVVKLTAFYIAINAGLMMLAGILAAFKRSHLPDDPKPERHHGGNPGYLALALILLGTARFLGGDVILIHAIGLPVTAADIALMFALSGPLPGEPTPMARRAAQALTSLSVGIGVAACLILALTAPG
jgi:hypothetical protein